MRLNRRQPDLFEEPPRLRPIPNERRRAMVVKVNAIRVNLCPDKDGARKIVLRLGRQMFPPQRAQPPRPSTSSALAHRLPHSRSHSGIRRDRPRERAGGR